MSCIYETIRCGHYPPVCDYNVSHASGSSYGCPGESGSARPSDGPEASRVLHQARAILLKSPFPSSDSDGTVCWVCWCWSSRCVDYYQVHARLGIGELSDGQCPIFPW